MGTLIREEPTLRLRMAFGFLSMASFSGLWTSIAFLLSGPSYGYSEGVIGLFSLAGLAGAGMAAIAGRVADAGHQLAATRLAAAGLSAAGACSPSARPRSPRCWRASSSSTSASKRPRSSTRA